MIELFPNSYPRYNQLFTRQSIQNGVLTTKNAMPMKDTTSTNDTDFSIDRRKYTKINQIVPQNQNAVTYNMTSDSSGHKNNMGVGENRNITISKTEKSNNDYQKKWYGNRDASQIVSNRRVNAVGKGTLNESGSSLSFVTKNDNNTQRDARKRARSGGATVPAKVIHKYQNAHIFY
jgi:hypothetical protein